MKTYDENGKLILNTSDEFQVYFTLLGLYSATQKPIFKSTLLKELGEVIFSVDSALDHLGEVGAVKRYWTSDQELEQIIPIDS